MGEGLLLFHHHNVPAHGPGCMCEDPKLVCPCSLLLGLRWREPPAQEPQ